MLISILYRDPAYFNYAAYLFCVVLLFGYRDGLFFHVLPFVTNNPENYRIIMGLSFLMFYFYCGYARHFLDLRNLNKYLERSFRYYGRFHLVLVFLVFFPLQLIFEQYHLAVDIVVASIPLFLLINLITVFHLLRRKKIIYNFFIAGFAFIVLGIVFGVFVFTVYSDTFNIVVKASILGEVLIFSLGLGYRMRRIELDKIQAQKEAMKLETASKIELEQKVKERTSQLEEAKERLEKTNLDIVSQRDQLEKAVLKLKSAQDQLVHSEKMASLGELTAGIAHEIQNPLNFVNNFSELNKELLEDLKEAVAKNDQREVSGIMDSLAQNEGKITQHGKRAEEIVRSMLHHSRISTGEKELTNINSLAEEYLRLAYHGLRAKDKSFNATFKSDLDPELPQIKVIPQEIGRVLLNLINNAFQAVTLRQAQDDASLVVVSTKKLDNKTIQIVVSDNGPGIPDEIKDKIFQPFFTTKPTGQGTGLGLSMSYDIITKGHGGTIEMESQNGTRTSFFIMLPMDS